MRTLVFVKKQHNRLRNTTNIKFYYKDRQNEEKALPWIIVPRAICFGNFLRELASSRSCRREIEIVATRGAVQFQG
jgi:cell fate regulator YaaT (PSP1 superfamily)